MHGGIGNNRPAAIHFGNDDARQLNKVGFWVFLSVADGTKCEEKYAERENLFHTVMTSIGLVFVKNDTDILIANAKGTPKKRSIKPFWPFTPRRLN